MTNAPAIRVGRAYDLKTEAQPIAPPGDPASSSIAGIAPVPASLLKTVEVSPEWHDTPSIDGQAVKHPGTVRGTGIVTEVFNLGEPHDLNRYNELQGKATPKNPTIVIVRDQPQFSEKTANWIVFFQYRKIQFRKLVPEKVENN